MAGYAQPADAPTPPPLVTAPLEPQPQAPAPRGEIIPRRQVSGPEKADLMIPRVLLSTVLGSVASAGGVLGGGLVGLGLSQCAAFEGDCNEPAMVVPMLLGAWGLSSLTVYGIGSVLNGEGGLLPTFLGGAVGTGMGAIFLVTDNGPTPLWLLALAGPAIGAIVGFEFSHASFEPALPQTLHDRSSIQVVPVLGMTPSGGVLGGLSGRF
ncbi:hypothetical protein [Hyalangium rubrum]|uniref:Uncharacterized protein n=1 Tax=Hyalangium rubrum TaxID=3103134 RepID=A0ABU5H382_9BACT|nr:hypothetical protein [Hyalangium sp. s54d21]MDY7227354.1 hypothetical protein [Hyalangium sp. s54d21]